VRDLQKKRQKTRQRVRGDTFPCDFEGKTYGIAAFFAIIAVMVAPISL